MIRKAIFSIFSLFLIFSGNCQAVEIIPAEEPLSTAEMTSYEYVNYYSANNSEWNVCIVSTDHLFRQNCYYYNYKFDNEGHLILRSCISGDSWIVTSNELEYTFIHTYEKDEVVPIVWKHQQDNVLFIAE